MRARCGTEPQSCVHALRLLVLSQPRRAACRFSGRRDSCVRSGSSRRRLESDGPTNRPPSQCEFDRSCTHGRSLQSTPRRDMYEPLPCRHDRTSLLASGWGSGPPAVVPPWPFEMSLRALRVLRVIVGAAEQAASRPRAGTIPPGVSSATTHQLLLPGQRTAGDKEE